VQVPSPTFQLPEPVASELQNLTVLKAPPTPPTHPTFHNVVWWSDKYDVNFAGHKTFLNFMMSTLDKNLVEVGTRTAVMKSSASQWKQGSMFC
jgi:hypothetical protein